MLRTIIKWQIRSAIASTVLTTAVATYAYKKDEGIARIMQWSMYFAPSMPYYYLASKIRSDEERYEKIRELNKTYAPDHLKNILKMKGYYVKSAQIFNVFSGFYGIQSNDEYSILVDQVPPRDFEVVKEIVESEFGKPIHEVYKTFDE